MRGEKRNGWWKMLLPHSQREKGSAPARENERSTQPSSPQSRTKKENMNTGVPSYAPEGKKRETTPHNPSPFFSPIFSESTSEKGERGRNQKEKKGEGRDGRF